MLLAAAMSVPGWGQSQDRFVLTAPQIARTLSDQGMQITDSVSLLARVVATEPHPVLDIISVAPLGERWSAGRSETHSLVKLGCHLPGTCLPFYVIVHGPEGPVVSAANGTGALALPTTARMKTNTATTMRAGTHAMLVMDDTRSHVQVSVISLQNGNAGDRIRVASPDRKQVYTAEVIDANLLKRSY